MTSFLPATSEILGTVQLVVPVAHPLSPRVPHTTHTSAVPDARPASVRTRPFTDLCVTVMVGPAVPGDPGAGDPVPGTLMFSVTVGSRPAASHTVAVATFLPMASGISGTVQLVVPVAHPLFPPSLPHTMWVSSVPDARPASVKTRFVTVCFVTVMMGPDGPGDPGAGDPVPGAGEPVPVPVPTTAFATRSPSVAVKVTCALTVAATVGLKRTVTVRLAPAASVNGLPATILNASDDAAADPDIAVLCKFRTVKVRSTKLPTLTFP